MNKKFLTILLSVLLPTFLVGAVVYATTSIGDDITVEDALTVTGATVLNGNVTLGNEATDTVTIDGPVTLGGTTATGLTFTGAYATAAIQLGTSASKMALAGADDHAIDVWTTNDKTSGTVRSVDISQTHTGAGAIAEALTSTLTSDVAIGSWGNAIFGKVDLLSDGYTTGQVGVICAELTFASSSAPAGGDYVLYQAEINCPGSCDMNGRPIHVLDVHSWGDQKAQFDTVGYLFEVGGVTPAAGKIVSLTSQTIRAKIETASPVADLTRYLVLSQMQDGLGLGVSGTPMAITVDTRASEIYTTSGATTGTVRSMTINQVQSVASAVTILEAFRVNIEADVQTGDWVNAIVGRIDYKTDGDASGGTAAAISAEIMFPDSSMPGGEYSALALEMGTAANTVFHANASYPYAFIKMQTWGAKASEMDDHAYLINLKGLTAGAGSLISANSQTLKARILAADRYLVLSQAEDSLTLSGATGGISVTNTALASGAYNSAIKSVSTLANGGTSEGIAGYFEAHLGGASTYASKLLYGVGAWINLDAGTTLTGGTVRALDVGVWANDSTITAESTEFVGINIDMHFDISDDAATIYPLRFNTTQAGANPDAWFRAANHEAIASTLTAGTYSTADGYITVNIQGTTYRIPYFLAVD